MSYQQLFTFNKLPRSSSVLLIALGIKSLSRRFGLRRAWTSDRPAGTVVGMAMMVALSGWLTPAAFGQATPPPPAFDVEAIIARARQNLGSEEALTNVKTLRFIGRNVERGGGRTSTLTLDYEAPTKHRMVQEDAQRIVTTVIDGFEGFIYTDIKALPGINRLRVLTSDEVAFFMSNVRENLNFYRGPLTVLGGTVEHLGETIRRGQPVHRVRFRYPNGASYDRFFDRNSFELRATLVNRGDYELVEFGQQTIGGIRFAERIETYSQDGHLTQTFFFDAIEVNPTFPEGHFELPEGQIFGYDLPE